jgi:hypothetical protein
VVSGDLKFLLYFFDNSWGAPSPKSGLVHSKPDFSFSRYLLVFFDLPYLKFFLVHTPWSMCH